MTLKLFRTLGRLPRGYARLLAALAQAGWFCHGTVVARPLRRKVAGRWVKKGPYYLWTGKSQGRTICYALSQEQYQAAKQAIAANRKVTETVARLQAMTLKEIGSSEKFLPGVMKTEESENQVTLVTQTICLAKKCLDLIVDAFHAAVVDPVLPPGKNAALMAEESSGQLPHLANSRIVAPSAPLVKERPHLAVGGLLPEQPQGLFQQVAGEQRLIVFERFVEARQFLLLDVVAAQQQQVTDSLNGLLHLTGGFADHLSGQVVQFLVHQLDDVKPVEHNRRLRQMLQHGGPVSGAHVHRHRLDLGMAQAQGRPERAQRLPAPSFGHPDDLTRVQVNDQRVELLVPAKVNLVNGQTLERPEAGVAIVLLQPGLDDEGL